MHELPTKVLALFILVVIFISSCSTGNAPKALNNKEDSLSFAREILKQYEGENSMRILQQDTAAPATLATKGMQPISWATFEKYSKYYDENPLLFNPLKQPYKGYIIDTAGYTMLMNNTNIKGLYLRLGRREDGAYTIMILGTDANGQVIQTSGALINTTEEELSNFDQLEPCPLNCPDIDEP